MFTFIQTYPPATSLIPIHVALARFLEKGGLEAIFHPYPFWYLGTTPFRYLTGPILPWLMVFLRRFLILNYFEVFYLLMVCFFLLGTGGVYLLVRELKGQFFIALLATVFYFFGPIIPFLFRFSDGLSLMVFSLLPFVLILYLKLLKQWRIKTAVFLIFLIAGLFLLSTTMIPTLILGLTAILLTQTGWKKVEEKIRQTLLILLFAFLIATFWYTPGYWLTLVSAPSLAGQSLFSVIIALPRLLAVTLAFVLAIFSSRFLKQKDQLGHFCFYWLFFFGFLTLMRFLSDPDFWLDWSAYGNELQLGLGIGLAFSLSQIKKKTWLNVVAVFLVFLSVASGLFVFHRGVVKNLQKEISQSLEYQIGKKLSEIVQPEEKVFLSGTTVFWVNAFFDLYQVRGGVDQVAVHPTWDQATWEIREGREIKKTIEWLKELKVDYLVVHDQNSKEYYHDFLYPEKFESNDFLKIDEKEGDIIYKMKE